MSKNRKFPYYLLLLVFLPALLLFSCNDEVTDDGAQSESNYIELSFDSAEPIIISNPELILSIYGRDGLLQDFPATLIAKENFESGEVPFSLRVKIPEDPSSLIEPLQNEEQVRYYLSLDWDSDGNGSICDGDITIDYEKKIPNLDLSTKDPQTIYLTLIPESTLCE